MTTMPTTIVPIIEGVAAAAAPFAGPYGVLADTLLTQGLQFWLDFQTKKAAGTLTMADLDAAAAKTGADIAQLAADIAVQAAVKA